MRGLGLAIALASSGCDLVLPPADLPAVDPCGSEPFDSRRYAEQWVDEPGIPWDVARLRCQVRGWELATIDDATEAANLGTLHPSSVHWIGLTDVGTDKWESRHGCPDPMVWDAGQPDFPDEDCAALDDSALHSYPCDGSGAITPSEFWCEQPRPETVWCVTDAEAAPVPTRYQMISAVPFAGAQQRCETMGGYLVVFDTPDEHAAVIAMFSGDFWIGAREPGAEGQWVTSTGCPGYLPWRVSEPLDTTGDEDCAISENGELNDLRCDEMRAAVCEIPP